MTEHIDDLLNRLWEAHKLMNASVSIFQASAMALEGFRHDMERLEGENQGLSDIIAKDVVSKVKANLVITVEEMEQALEFYADPANYRLVDSSSGLSPVLQDAGETARTVLSQYRGLDSSVAPVLDPEEPSA